MLGLDMLDLAIGVVFVYLLVSLIASAIAELIENRLKKRASDLERGIKELLGDDQLAAKLYQHPLVAGLYRGEYDQAKAAGNLPSYIPAQSFALALMDIVFPSDVSGASGATPKPAAPSDVQKQADSLVHIPDQILQALRAQAKASAAAGVSTKLPDDLARALVLFVDASNRDASKVRENIETWFNSGMDRVSGWYKRRNHQILVAIGLVLSILFNVDSIAIVNALWTNKSVRDATVNAATEFARAQANQETRPGTATSAQPVTDTQPATTTQPATSTVADSTSTAGAATTTQAATSTDAVTTTAAPALSDEQIKQNIKTYRNAITSLPLPIGWSQQGCPTCLDQNGDRPTGIRKLFDGCWWSCWLALIWTMIGAHLFGWIITAMAVSLGAPFWFDTLNKIIVIRSTVKPQEKSGTEKSKS